MKWKTPVAGAVAVGLAVAGYQLLRPEPVNARHVPITTKIVFNRDVVGSVADQLRVNAKHVANGRLDLPWRLIPTAQRWG